VANHRADRRAVSRRPADHRGAATQNNGSAHRHRAETDRSRHTHSGGRKRLMPRYLSAPTIVGAAVLALAAAGVLSGSTSQGSASQLAGSDLAAGRTMQASALIGQSAVAHSQTLDRRAQAVSRDSSRDALADASNEKLQAAAEQQAKERNAALAKLAANAEKQAGVLAKNAWGLPVPHGVYHLTARFGQCAGLWSHCHTGLDFAAPEGTPIHAIANGTITETGWAGAYGNRTVMTLSDGTDLWYAHQSAIGVTKGQKVVAGQVIGRVGSTGNTTGPHVHIEVRPGGGDPVDPYQAMIAHGLKP
jgi:murein DD-endopeptidase MepM/ murein hydrolase activator NlpD